MSTLNYAIHFIGLRTYELFRLSALQVETENGGFPWWGYLLILGLVILIVVLAIAWNASKTSVPKIDHSSPEMHADTKSPPAPSLLADDLTRIEGIGPKIASLLKERGITSFEQLGSADSTVLRTMLEDARLQFADPTTWPEQARLAADANWEALAALQADLKGGRR